MPVLKTSSPEETAGVGEKLGLLLQTGDVVCLNGELGAGKTVFAKGVAKGLTIKEPVTSPTFTLINQYYGRLPLYHMDVYRLEDPMEMEDLGYEEFFYGDGVTLVEWSGRVEELLPDDRLEIHLKRCPGEENLRELTINPRGDRYGRLLEELMALVRAGN